jgi:threonine dehydratase
LRAVFGAHWKTGCEHGRVNATNVLMSLTFDQIKDAAERLRGNVLVTPCVRSQTLSRLAGAEVFLKFENHQFTASFKERGALNKLLSLSANDRKRGVIAMSAGNHAQGVAYHAKRLGIPVVVVMPRHTPEVKVEHTRAHGAAVILRGDTFDQAGDFARTLAKRRKLLVVHPYDDFQVMAGQGTVALEMLAQQPDLQTLLVPVGGGGMIAGMAVAANRINPRIEIIGVQSENFPAMAGWLRRQAVKCGRFTVAEGIAVKSSGHLTRPIVKKFVRDILLVGEMEIENAILLLLQIEKTVVEGAGACGLAALLGHSKQFRGKKVGLVLSGGNIDLLVLSAIIRRGLVRSGHLVRLRVETRDVPGEMGRLAGLIGTAGGNIQEVSHQRAFSAEPVQTAVVDFILQIRGLDHLGIISNLLQSHGYRMSLPDQALFKNSK